MSDTTNTTNTTGIDAYRLTVTDETRASTAMADAVRAWRESSPRRTVTNAGTNLLALVRVGAHSIGCGIDDLRASEVSWLTAVATGCMMLTDR